LLSTAPEIEETLLPAIRGRSGITCLQVLSTQQVQVDLDANGDGSLESSTPRSWDWLF